MKARKMSFKVRRELKRSQANSNSVLPSTENTDTIQKVRFQIHSSLSSSTPTHHILINLQSHLQENDEHLSPQKQPHANPQRNIFQSVPLSKPFPLNNPASSSPTTTTHQPKTYKPVPPIPKPQPPAPGSVAPQPIPVPLEKILPTKPPREPRSPVHTPQTNHHHQGSATNQTPQQNFNNNNNNNNHQEQPGREYLSSLAGFLDQTFRSISHPAHAVHHAEYLAREMIRRGGLREIVQPSRVYSRSNPAHDIIFELLDLVYCQDDLAMANHSTGAALHAFQSQFLAHPAALGAVFFARLDINCPVAITLMTKCGVEALDLVYGALKWQQLVLGFPPWTHAAQQKGVLTFQGHWIRAAVLNNNNDNNNSGTDGDKEEEKEHVPSPYRVVYMACRPINFSSLPGSVVALFLACVYQEANRCWAWHQACNGAISGWSDFLFSNNNLNGNGNNAPGPSHSATATATVNNNKYSVDDLAHWIRMVLGHQVNDVDVQGAVSALLRATW